MDVDLFGKSTGSTDPLRLELSADEIKESVNRETLHRWHYIGVLAVPVQKNAALLNRLLQGRDGCDSEIKSTEFDHSLKRRTAVSWVNVLFENYRDASIDLSLWLLRDTSST